jgi:pantothenate kinase-related protein Tda10
LSVKELNIELDRLSEEASEEATRIENLQIQNWTDLKSHYASLVNMGAKDFRQALEWDMQAEDCIYEGGYMDFGMYCYTKGVEYSKERTFERLAA